MIADFHVYSASADADMEGARTLFREYQQWLNVDLCFQDFESELAALPGSYIAPEGCLYLVTHKRSGDLAGCVALRPEQGDRCEMKRLYVREGWRGHGLGRHLAQLCLDDAVQLGYRRMCLDTIGFLKQARALYASMGFKEIPAYYENPLQDVIYMEKDLTLAKSAA